MTGQRDTVKKLFLEAADKATPAERAAFLDEACAGDEHLRRSVEALLLVHDQPDRLLDQPAVERLGDRSINQADARSEFLAHLAPSQRPDSLGRLGNYDVLEVVGQGGMGIVVRAFDEKLHRIVAIKALVPVLAANASARQRFVREARAAAAVTHDNVIGIHAVEDGGRVPYLVMQFIAGSTLQEKLDRAGPLALKEILRIGLQIAEGLAAAHRQGVIHRDIKPANILLENGVERVRITDFGLARTADDTSLTQSGYIAGTPTYMSPEQAKGEHVDRRTDLFSLGSVLYSLCAGHPPFRADSALAVLKRVCEETPRPLRDINPELPEWMQETVAKLHAKNPADRFDSATEVAAVLSRCLAQFQTGGDYSGVGDPTVLGLPRHRGAKRRLTAARLAVAAALLAALGAAGWWAYKSWFGDRPVSTVKNGDDPKKLEAAGPAQPVILKPSRTLMKHSNSVRCLAFAPDGKTLASGGLDRSIYLWDASTWEARGPLEGHPGDVSALAFAPDSRRFVSLTSSPDDCLLRLWDVATGNELAKLGEPSIGMWDVAYAPDGQTIACGGWDKKLHLLDVASGTERLVIADVAPRFIRALSFSRDGRRIATGGNGPPRIWDTVSGAEVSTPSTLPLDLGPTLLPDGTGLAGWIYRDGTVAICDLPSGRVRATWRAQAGTIEGMAVSADGRFLATIGNDGTARVWSTADHAEIATLMGHKGRVFSVAFSPDGTRLATGGSDDHAICIWDLPAVCRVVK